ncbi:MAG: L,D-transpeptidase [Gammaproteobacteria bacterium]|jgi:lipoprotein-anchoring transpeptidase ErfK/SrfK
MQIGKILIVGVLTIILAGCTFTPSDPDGDKDTKGSNYFPTTRPATGRRVFIFDPNYRAWAVYNEEGRRINTGKSSGGAQYCPDVGRPCRTISGTFSILRKGGADCISTKFPIETNGGAPMPYCMHFKGGYAIHGSGDIPNHNASHGCIRVSPIVAKWLNNNFLNVGSTVIIKPYHS